MERCTYLGCTNPVHWCTWVENLTIYSVSIYLCREHHKEYVDLLYPFMRSDERADVRAEQQGGG